MSNLAYLQAREKIIDLLNGRKAPEGLVDSIATAISTGNMEMNWIPVYVEMNWIPVYEEDDDSREIDKIVFGCAPMTMTIGDAHCLALKIYAMLRNHLTKQ